VLEPRFDCCKERQIEKRGGQLALKVKNRKKVDEMGPDPASPGRKAV